MNRNNQKAGINRREFLEKSAKFAVSAAALSLSTSKLWALPSDIEKNTIPYVTLNNGVKMPIIGSGTLSMHGAAGEKCIVDAISSGFRLIDTATVYGNEETVGAGIKLSGIDRKELFVTSKVWVEDSGYEKALKAFETSLNKLQMDYLDLYLIHRPRGDVQGSWKAMEELYRAGKIKSIGVSNFDAAQLNDLIKNNKVKPAVNQIETHAFFQQPEMYSILKKHKIQMEAWSPFAQGRNGLFTNPVLAEIGKKYNKTNAQVSLRWHFQRGIVAIPRSLQVEHMKENLNIFDFKLSRADMKAIAPLDLNVTQFPEWE